MAQMLVLLQHDMTVRNSLDLCAKKTESVERGLTIVFSFIFAELLSRMEEQIGHVLPEDVFDALFLVLLDTRLTFHMVYEQVGSIV